MDSELYAKLEHLLGVRRTADVRRLVAPGLAAAPDDAELHQFLARAACLDGDTGQARDHLERVLALDPDHSGARYLLFEVLIDEAEYSEAETLVIELIREHPADADYLAAYARLMLLTLHLEKARLLTQEALRHEPEHRGALLVEVLIATARGDHDQARLTLEEVLRDEPDAYRTTHTLFYVLLKQKRYREAEKVGQQLLRTNPTNVDLVDALIDIRTQTHWSALPAYPVTRYGWAGVAGMWVIGAMGARVIARFDKAAAGIWALAYVALCIYSWVYPSILKRRLRARGI